MVLGVWCVQLWCVVRVLSSFTCASTAIAHLHALPPVRASHQLGSNVAVGRELWALLLQFPWQQRYSLYYFWKTEAYDTHEFYAFARARVRLRAATPSHTRSFARHPWLSVANTHP